MTPLCSSISIKSRLHLLRRRPNPVTDWSIEPAANLSSRSLETNAKQEFCRKMSTGATRASTAATSRDVKQKLVKLLFPENYSRMDSNGLERYSYENLRREYLKRLQVIHPDKINANSIDANLRQFRSQKHQNYVDPFNSKEELKREFQELQSTWDRYQVLSKSMMKVIQGDGVTANFTKFGVGCSFSDNEEEKALRKEITDQACRGWFASGLVSSGMSTKNEGSHERDENFNSIDKDISASSKFSHEGASEQKSLIDDSMFVQVDSCDNEKSGTLSRGTKSNISRRYQRTLVPGINFN